MNVMLRTILVLLSSLSLAACALFDDSSDSGFAPTHGAILTTAPDAVLETSGSLANSNPNFGSITQSSNVGAADTTTDSVSTTFDGSDVTLTITRDDDSTLIFDSATDSGYSTAVEEESAVPGLDRSRGRSLSTYSSTSASASSITVHWDSMDSTDYIAGGYWLHLTGIVYDNVLYVSGVEVGAFADGPELDGRPTLPTTGTATYRGSAAGLYVANYGGAAGDREGTFEIGDYLAPLTLNVDFTSTATSIDGCIGCTDDDETFGYIDVIGWRVLPNGDEESYNAILPGRLTLQSTDIESDGTFTGERITYEQVGYTVNDDATSGTWGGKFSKINHEGIPRLVAGTNGANIVLSDGSNATLVGVFIGVPQSDQTTE